MKAKKSQELYFYALGSKKEIKELDEASKNWKGVSAIALHIKDTAELTDTDLGSVGGDILNKIIKHNEKL